MSKCKIWSMLQDILHVLFCSILPGASRAVIIGPLLFLSYMGHCSSWVSGIIFTTFWITLWSFSKVKSYIARDCSHLIKFFLKQCMLHLPLLSYHVQREGTHMYVYKKVPIYMFTSSWHSFRVQFLVTRRQLRGKLAGSLPCVGLP